LAGKVYQLGSGKETRRERGGREKEIKEREWRNVLGRKWKPRNGVCKAKDAASERQVEIWCLRREWGRVRYLGWCLFH
jgi:hypothetical protein